MIRWNFAKPHYWIKLDIIYPPGFYIVEVDTPFLSSFVTYYLWLIVLVKLVGSEILRLNKCSKFDAHFSVYKKDKKLVGGLILARLESHTWNDCVSGCIRHDDCKSINYNMDPRICELLDVETGNEGARFESHHDWMHVETPKNRTKVCVFTSTWVIFLFQLIFRYIFTNSELWNIISLIAHNIFEFLFMWSQTHKRKIMKI